MSNWNSGSHSKFLLQYHLIFVCKYRKNLFENKRILKYAKQLSIEICSKHNVIIKHMEADKDHIHYMLETTANINLAKFISTMKSYVTYHLWNNEQKFLSLHFWKEKTFFTDGYFICSIGNISEQTLKQYIDNQG